MPEEGISKSLDYMIDIHTNIEQLASMFQSRAGEMMGALNSLEAGASKVGKSFSEVMQMQMATSLKNVETATITMATTLPSALKDLNETMITLTQTVNSLSQALSRKFGVATEDASKKIKKFKEKISDIAGEKAHKTHQKTLKDLGASFRKISKEAKTGGINFKNAFKTLSKGSSETSGAVGALEGIKEAAFGVAKGANEMGLKAYGGIKSFHDFGRAAMTSLSGLGTILKGLARGANAAAQIAFSAINAIVPGLGEVLRVLYQIQKVLTKVLVSAIKYFARRFMAYMTTLITAVKSMAKALWKIFQVPLQLIAKGIKWIIRLLGGLSFADAIKGLTTLDIAANDMARTMVGGVTSVKSFHKTYTKLMSDMTNTAYRLGASVEDIKTTFVGLASMHIPVGQLKSLATISYQAAKGLGLGVEQATQLVGTLRHVGKLSDTEIKGVLGNFAILQQNIGLSANETQALANAVTDFAKRVRGIKGGTEVVKSFTNAASKLSAVFIKAGIDAQEAANQIQKLFDPAQLENNVALYAKLGMSISDVMNIMQGSEKIPEDMANRFVQLSKQIVAMGPVAGKAYAETMGMTYGMAQQLANITGNAVDQVNKMFGKTADREKALQEQRIRQEEQLARKLEIARNKMALNMMETMRPMLQQMKDFLDVIGKMIDGMRPLFQAIGKLFSSLFSQLSVVIDPLSQIVNSMMDFFTKSGVIKTVADVFTEIANLIVGIIPMITDIAKTLGQLVGGVIKDLLGAIKQIIPNLKPIIVVLTNIFKVIVSNLLKIFDSLLGSLFPKAEKEASGFSIILNIIAKALGMMGTILGNILKSLQGPLQNLFQMINRVLVSLQGPLQEFMNSISVAFTRFGKVLGILTNRIVTLLRTIDWKKLVTALTKFIEIKLSRMVQKVEDFSNTVLSETNVKRTSNIINWILKIFTKIEEILNRIRIFFHRVGSIVRAFVSSIGDLGHLGKNMKAAMIGSKVDTVYSLVETGNYEVAAEKLLKYYHSRRKNLQQAARQLIQEFDIPIDALQSPEKLSKYLNNWSHQLEQSTETTKDLLNQTTETGTAAKKRTMVRTTVEAYKPSETLTRETYKGMTDKQADELIEEQKRANSITDKLFSAISLLNENISELFTDVLEIKRYVREIDANTRRI